MTKDEAAIETAKRWGWELNARTGKWRNPNSSASYANTPRWGRYVCEDHGIAIQQFSAA